MDFSSPSTDRKHDKLVRALGHHLERNELNDFETKLTASISSKLLSSMRSQKTLTRGTDIARAEARSILLRLVPEVLEKEQSDEYARYIHLTDLILRLRRRKGDELKSKILSLPALSMNQLLEVADRTFKSMTRFGKIPYIEAIDADSASKNERMIHERAGHGNDVLFALTKAINEAAIRVRDTKTSRPDTMAKALKAFPNIVVNAGFIASLEYIFDAVSYGELTVSDLDAATSTIKFDFADVRRTLLRTLAIRRKLILLISGRDKKRWVKEKLRPFLSRFTDTALDRYVDLEGRISFSDSEISRFKEDCDAILSDIEAEDDLLYLSAGSHLRTAILYNVSLALRVHSLAGDLFSAKLFGKQRRSYDLGVSVSHIVNSFLEKNERDEALLAIGELSVKLPVRGHFELIRRPFIRVDEDTIRPVTSAAYGSWAAAVRETINQGGETGRLYGKFWEDFIARSFEGTGWEILGRNITLTKSSASVTEADLLICRDDLLLVAEIKALTGSAYSQYDHWKNRMVIEKGCRQAATAAQLIRDDNTLLSSIADRRTARRIKHVQPIVLTNEDMFDGWEHVGVPVAGETIRHAITVGTKVEYYHHRGSDVMRTDWHLSAGELTTPVILAALRDPIELKLAPEKGAIRRIQQETAGWTFLIPDTAVGMPDSGNSSHGEIVKID